MKRVNKILAATLAAGVVGSAGAAMADYRYGYNYRTDHQIYGDPNGPRVGLGRSVTADINASYHSRPSTTYYYYPSYRYAQPRYHSYRYVPAPTYRYTSPAYRYDRSPNLLEALFAPLIDTSSDGYDYDPNRGWGQYYHVRMRDGSRYHPYWAYQGPLGQGSGHDMRIGR